MLVPAKATITLFFGIPIELKSKGTTSLNQLGLYPLYILTTLFLFFLKSCFFTCSKT